MTVSSDVYFKDISVNVGTDSTITELHEIKFLLSYKKIILMITSDTSLAKLVAFEYFKLR